MKGRRKPTVVEASNNGLKELPYYGCTGNLAVIHCRLNNSFLSPYKTKRHLNEGVVSKETVVLRRWGSRIRSDEGLTLETSAFRISVRWPIYIIKFTKFL